MGNVIQKLSEVTVNLIAAGEVVLGPASVVKELVENALDAGATQIDIWLESGGKNFIRVKDNGIGMTRDDMLLSFHNHTTSKLDQNDLNNISTFGFRGEALASIASVSKINMMSRYKGSNESYQILLSGGTDYTISPVIHDYGTTIEVRELFFSTPARLHFLKSDKAEAARCLSVIKNISLAHLDKSFACYIDGKQVFQVLPYCDLSIQENLLNRASSAMCHEFVDNALFIDSRKDDVHLTGVISVPTYSKVSTDSQIFFVNGRPIKDKIFSTALRIAYRDVIPAGRYPYAVLFLTTSPYDVDVNVHPSKTEIRFKRPYLLKDFVTESIKVVLRSVSHLSATRSIDLDSFQKSNCSISSPFLQEDKHLPYFTDSKELFELKPDVKTYEKVVESDSYPLGAARFQIGNSFIISQTSDGIVLVDQHAAHERLLYESMKSSFLERNAQTQKLLYSVKVVLSSEEAFSAIVERLDLLSRIGLVLEVLSDDCSVQVVSVPLLLVDHDIAQIVKDLSDDLVNMYDLNRVENILEHVCKTWACYHSLRAGRSLSLDEMNELLRKIETTSNAGQCNHGRPSYVKLSVDKIRKIFERT
ncbi:DNA mismatch repair endonuclease MutL [Candidatus Sneabacter namystus]|uniref:DNA mismatch repair protein MutL n=1 Tax=Candidatus Sneabacter namystus TaxID=2601646 RepID=A0A5C0UID0_9RICK|nr:DNA mismatch repair endonuclease MutL [Candidatus Sneabacter namystus]QEK39826.1 DNA mismatch repair endonuclease MutL [Candidatus Sneabacter namystus]